MSLNLLRCNAPYPLVLCLTIKTDHLKSRAQRMSQVFRSEVSLMWLMSNIRWVIKEQDRTWWTAWRHQGSDLRVNFEKKPRSCCLISSFPLPGRKASVNVMHLMHRHHCLTRLEICRDRQDWRSCKIFPNCVKFWGNNANSLGNSNI